MNATEQRDRHTAVRTIERRIEDVETVVTGMAQAIVDDRTAVNRVQKAISDDANRVLDAQDARIAAMIADRDRRIAEWAALTLRQRLRWLFLGR